MFFDIAIENNEANENLFIIEVKTAGNIKFDNNDIIKKYQENIKENRYKKVLDQIFTHMHLKQTKYGMLSTYFETLFIQLLNNNGEPLFLLSKPIKPEFFYLLHSL